MNIDNYPSNQQNRQTQEQKKERPKALPAVKHAPTEVKPTMRRRIFDAFFNPSDMESMGDRLIFKVIIPGSKRIIAEMIGSFFGIRGAFSGARLFDPEDPWRNDGSKYSNISNRSNSASRLRSSVYDMTEAAYDYPEDAEDLLAALIEYMDANHIMSVNDYYDMARLEPKSPQDCKYGWTDIRRAHIETNFDGQYIVKMPRPLPLD